MRKHAKVDKNHLAIVHALRKAGASVQSLADVGGGCPDLLVSKNGVNYCLEVKDGNAIPSKQRLTPDEAKWRDNWRGQYEVIYSIEDALEAIERKP